MSMNWCARLTDGCPNQYWNGGPEGTKIADLLGPWSGVAMSPYGECTRGLGPAGETVDPEWGLIDPPAGEWFPEMALDLVQNANPPLD